MQERLMSALLAFCCVSEDVGRQGIHACVSEREGAREATSSASDSSPAGACKSSLAQICLHLDVC